jgi:hypothetical protein
MLCHSDEAQYHQDDGNVIPHRLAERLRRWPFGGCRRNHHVFSSTFGLGKQVG